jgi:hypothetical protein
MLRNLCAKERNDQLGSVFWGHIFNIGGGESCRVDTLSMYKRLFGDLGITTLSHALDSKWYATRNFHGHFYLDSDKLNDLLEFRRDSMEYFYEAYLKNLGSTVTIAKILTKLPGGQRLMGSIMKKRFLKAARTEHGTVRFIEENREEEIAAYWGSRKAWEAIPPLEEFEHFTDWDTVVPIDHGYDENKPEEELALDDMRKAAEFRGGVCLSSSMHRGDWTQKLTFRCAFGHEFAASPRLVLEGGHWCPDCERESWNYYERAKRDPFFAQVWYPLHPKDEKEWRYDKKVSELDV